MQYEKEMLENLLKESGIDYKLDNRIRPNKHPNMKRLEVALKNHGVNYMYFHQTDSLAITQVDIGEHNALCHTLMMPSLLGISVLIIVNEEASVDIVLHEMGNSLDRIVPDGLGYDIVGVF